MQSTVKKRKTPRQARSKATVSAILEASSQILTAHGFETFTTTHVAERAGVSIGSLYQYFPNRTALAAAVIEDACGSFLQGFDNLLVAYGHETLDDAVSAIVDATIVSHKLSPVLHKLVGELAPLLGVNAVIDDTSRKLTASLEGVLLLHKPNISPSIDLAEAAVLIETFLETIVHRRLSGGDTLCNDEHLAQEVKRFIMSYLVNSQSYT